MDGYYKIQHKFTDTSFVSKFLQSVVDFADMVKASNYNSILEEIKEQIKPYKTGDLTYRYNSQDYKVHLQKGFFSVDLSYEPLQSINVLCKYKAVACELVVKERSWETSNHNILTGLKSLSSSPGRQTGNVAVRIVPKLGYNYVEILREINAAKESYDFDWVIVYETLQIPLEAIFSHQRIKLISIEQIENAAEIPLEITVW